MSSFGLSKIDDKSTKHAVRDKHSGILETTNPSKLEASCKGIVISIAKLVKTSPKRLLLESFLTGETNFLAKKMPIIAFRILSAINSTCKTHTNVNNKITVHLLHSYIMHVERARYVTILSL